MRHLAKVLAAAAIVAATLTPAHPAGAVEFPSRARHWDKPQNPECTCRFMGENVPLGARRCLQTPEGPRTAECVMELNVTSWRPSHESCPQASLLRPGG